MHKIREQNLQNQRLSIPNTEINLKEQLKDNILDHFDT